NRVEKIGPAGAEKYYGLIEAKGSTKTYYYFLGGRRVAQRTIGGNVYFHQQDHLGSASVLSDPSGAVQSRTSYHEFGSIKWQEGQGGLSDYTYNDKRWDKETNFYDYGARPYNAKMFKFTTPDSLIPAPKNPQSLNRYAYVQNNPLKYTDPSGHSPEEERYYGTILFFNALAAGIDAHREGRPVWRDMGRAMLFGGVPQIVGHKLASEGVPLLPDLITSYGVSVTQNIRRGEEKYLTKRISLPIGFGLADLNIVRSDSVEKGNISLNFDLFQLANAAGAVARAGGGRVDWEESLSKNRLVLNVGGLRENQGALGTFKGQVIAMDSDLDGDRRTSALNHEYVHSQQYVTGGIFASERPIIFGRSTHVSVGLDPGKLFWGLYGGVSGKVWDDDKKRYDLFFERGAYALTCKECSR
ncbi:MAG TPA: RHS repeat-associated core domain-containing protein, partial [Bdellovibrionota bacterium]|nr:RHS repeat-associated core domain-containing protein [Bdellovibrionota bacterium]